jgi:hypothetical protein
VALGEEGELRNRRVGDCSGGCCGHCDGVGETAGRGDDACGRPAGELPLREDAGWCGARRERLSARGFESRRAGSRLDANDAILARAARSDGH